MVKRLIGAALVLVLTAMGACGVLTQPVLPTSRKGPVVDAEAVRLRNTVVEIAKPRDVDDPAALDAVARYLSDELRALGYQPQEQPYTAHEKTYRNIHLVIGDPAAPRLVVGAHYDSCKPLPAADDNASGVAVVLELARLLKERPPPGAVELVFWTLEEPPMFRTELMGSVIHAKAVVAAHVNVSAALAIETVGYYSDEPDSQHFPLAGLGTLYSTTGNYVALVSNLDNIGLVRKLKQAMKSTGSIAVFSMTAPSSIPGVDWSDHRSYWAQGIPALMVTDTAPNRNPNYHRASDTPDTLDYPRMAALTNALFEGIWVLSSASVAQ